MGRGDPPWEPPPYTEWLFGMGECFGPGWWLELLKFKRCSAHHVDLVLAIPLTVLLVLPAARKFGWITIRPREILLYVVCLGLAPTYVFMWWRPGSDLVGPIGIIIIFAFPIAVIFLYGIIRLWRHRGRPASPVTLTVVLLLALLGHGCVHYISWAGIS